MQEMGSGRIVRSFDTRLERLIRAIPIGIGWAIFALIVVTCTDVFGRYVLNKPLRGSGEISELILPYIIFVTMAYSLITGTHVKVTLIIQRLPHKFSRILEAGVLTLELTFVAWVTYAGWGLFLSSFKMQELMMSSISLPWWFGKFALPLGMFLFALALASRIFRHIIHREMPKTESETPEGGKW